MDKLVYRCWTKATTRERGQPRRSASWLLSRRAWFRVYQDRIECGDWIIPASEVKDAVLYEARQFFLTGRVLSIQMDHTTYQFGFNPWCSVVPHLPFPVPIEKVRIKHSPQSILVRLAVVTYLIYVLWRELAS